MRERVEDDQQQLLLVYDQPCQLGARAVVTLALKVLTLALTCAEKPLLFAIQRPRRVFS